MAIDKTNEELLGSQRKVAKMICDPKFIKRLFNYYQKFRLTSKFLCLSVYH